MRPSHNAAAHASTLDDSRYVTATVAALLVFAPLIYGGNAPVPLLVLELSSLALMGRLVFKPGFRSQLSAWGQWLLLLCMLLPLLYLIPVPLSVWGGLPGHTPYLEVFSTAFDRAVPEGPRAVSLNPFDSERGWYALLYPLAIFLVTLGLSETRIRLLVSIFLGVAVFQALLGFVQFVQGPESVFRLGNPYYLESGVGTYVNRANLAALLYLALPMSIALLSTRDSIRTSGTSTRRRSFVDISLLLLLMLAAVILLTGLVFTRSRAGIGLGFLGVLLASVLFSLRLGKKKLLQAVAAVVIVGVVAALLTGIAPVIARYASPDTIDNERWKIFSAAWRAANTFMPVGSGPSTFSTVFPIFQPGDVNGFVNRVHNDYLELYFEGGLILLVPVLLLVFQYLRHWGRVWGKGESWSCFRMLQAGAGISVLLMLLHSVLDFNLHIPANMGYFAFMSAIFMRRPSSSGVKLEETTGGEKNIASNSSRDIPDENLVNPFLLEQPPNNSA